MASRTLSGELFNAVLKGVVIAKEDRKGGVIRTDENNFSREAPFVFVHAALGLESFINEFVAINRHAIRTGKLVPVEEIQKLGLQDKFVLVPFLLGVETFDKSRCPFQDFNALVQIRNDLVHYKMPDAMDRGYPRWLESQKVLLFPAGMQGLTWLDNMSTFRGALWALRTVVAMIQELRRFVMPLIDSKRLFDIFPFQNPPDFLVIEKEYEQLCSDYPRNLSAVPRLGFQPTSDTDPDHNPSPS